MMGGTGTPENGSPFQKKYMVWLMLRFAKYDGHLIALM
jgi:hypothetical protein